MTEGSGVLAELSQRIDAPLASRLTRELTPLYAETSSGTRVRDAAVLLCVCYPALASFVRTQPADVTRVVGPELSTSRTRDGYLALLSAELGPEPDHARTRTVLRKPRVSTRKPGTDRRRSVRLVGLRCSISARVMNRPLPEACRW